MFRPLRALLFCLLLTLSVAGLAACGGSDSGDDPKDVLAETFGENKPIKSGKLDLAVRLDANGLESLPGPVSLRLQGPFESLGGDKLPKFDFDLDVVAGGQTISAGAVSTGDKGFLTFQDTAYDIGEKLFAQFKTGYEQASKDSGTAKKDAPSFKALGIDPRRWLVDAKTIGTEEVGGTKTTHIKSRVDVPKFLDDVNVLLGKAGDLGVAGAPKGAKAQQLTPVQRKQIAEAVKSAELDVYSGEEDRTLRRLILNVTFDVPEASRKNAGGLKDGRLRFELTIADLNKPQTIKAPNGARPLSELGGALGGLLGSASGGGGATGGGGAAPPAATPPAGTTPPATAPPAGAPSAGGAAGSEEYLSCLQSAGQDIAAVQKCADLLGK